MPVGSAYLPSTRCGPCYGSGRRCGAKTADGGMRHIADEQQALHQRLETVVQQLEQVQREVDVLKAKEAK